MKLIALGDIHGRPIWKQIADQNTFDKFIFIGDYFDSKEGIPAADQITNFKAIIDFKKSQPDKVILLFGNHDYHYLKYAYQTYNGFQFDQPIIQSLIQKTYEENLFQICYTCGDYMFTHAGVTNEWFRNNYEKEFSDSTAVELMLNELFKQKPTAFAFVQGYDFSPSGDSTYQSPIWVRPNSLSKDCVRGFKQIVGHTVQPDIQIFDSLVFIDALGTSKEYLVVDNWKITIARIQDSKE